VAGAAPSPRALARHAEACRAGEPGYVDPDSGLFVMTSRRLRERGYCCGQGCRHCPWPVEAQRAAGRPPAPAWPWPDPAC